MENLGRVVLFIWAISFCWCASEIPPFLHICHKSDPDFTGCVMKSVEALRPHLQNGNVEYNIPSVEPIVINDLIKDNTGPMKLETTAVQAFGGGSFELSSLKIDLDTYVFDFDVNIPNLKIEAKYHVDGKLMMMNIKGDGDFHANLTNCLSTTKIITKMVSKDGETYLEIIENKMKITVGGGTITLDNLFRGDKTLQKLINDAINQDIQPFLKDVMPYIERGLSAKFIEIGNQIISPYTVQQLFPE